MVLALQLLLPDVASVRGRSFFAGIGVAFAILVALGTALAIILGADYLLRRGRLNRPRR